MEAKAFTADAGAYKIEAMVLLCGKDLSVTVCGGTRHHIGAYAIGIPRPSLQDAEKCSASVSVYCVTGHKDDQVARHMAQKLSSGLGCVVTVCAGIHINAANEKEILLFIQGCGKLTEQILNFLKK